MNKRKEEEVSGLIEGSIFPVKNKDSREFDTMP